MDVLFLIFKRSSEGILIFRKFFFGSDILNSKKIALVINTGGGNSEHRISDARALRRATLVNKVPYCTNMSTAYACLKGIQALKTKKLTVKSIQES